VAHRGGNEAENLVDDGPISNPPLPSSIQRWIFASAAGDCYCLTGQLFGQRLARGVVGQGLGLTSC
jgi:hypothetical protein